MSMVSNFVSKLRELMRTMIGGKAIEDELRVTYAISSPMENAIRLWSKLYMNKAPWLKDATEDDPVRIASLGLPAMIASEKARMALLELESEITVPIKQVEVDNPDYPGEQKFITDVNGEQVLVPSVMPPAKITKDVAVSSAERAEYLESQYKKLKKQLRKQIEYGIAKGGLIIKPYVVVNKADNADGVNSDITPTIDIEFDFIQADAFYPLAFTASGKIMEAAFVQTKVEKAIVYRRLEHHKWENNVLTVVNKAYKSKNVAGAESYDLMELDFGNEIPLTDVLEWKDFQPKAVIKNVTQPLFGYFRMPEANTIDTNSPLGVSGYSRAISLIRDADMQYSALLWEYEGGQLAIDIDRDALRPIEGANGTTNYIDNKLQARLYRQVDLGSASDTYQPYAPALRDANYITGLNTILMRIEDVCGISRGTLSDSADIARTATELKILKQRNYQSNANIQKAIEEALRNVIYAMNVYASLYQITPEGEYEVSFEWDDSIIVDIDAEINKRLTLMQNGLTSKLELRMWYFGETENQARQALEEVQKEQQEQQANDLAMQYSQENNQGKDIRAWNKDTSKSHYDKTNNDNRNPKQQEQRN